jgi:MoaA/NifB/PqqE/SkfB family radical SAM enzyme
MFRVTQYLRELARAQAGGSYPASGRHGASGLGRGPVVIWNLTRRCNLTCKHCYAFSADHAYPGELSTEEVFGVMDDLKAFRVPVLILSGGEPLLRT